MALEIELHEPSLTKLLNVVRMHAWSPICVNRCARSSSYNLNVLDAYIRGIPTDSPYGSRECHNTWLSSVVPG